MIPVVDARGQACPQPVILTRQALQGHDAVTTIVDNVVSQANVSRLAQKMGCQVTVDVRPDGIYLHLQRGEQAVPQATPQAPAAPAGGPLVLVVPGELMGRGEDPVLGQVLMRGFFHALAEVEPLPDTVVFLNSGVRLATQGSPVTEDLQALQTQGVEILACGTCLGHFGLTDQLAVGQISNMYTITEALLGAGKVISL
ncbi:MAG: sulfurtransferase-like selenium metabolism protein YedF [Chloroflexi bacterium]|nr:sulfurtransferase-like selenium metabolism protein YedF [Chloroflexota bacterium]